MKRLTIALITAEFVLQSAFAWGPEGHRIVAHIAELRLNEHAQQAMAQIIAADTQISDNLVCNWPDYVRKERPESGPWHYVDIPEDAEAYDEHAFCPQGQCVISQVTNMAAKLADPALSIEERNTALRFLVHFVGDLHQPLHCADYDDDRGGNSRPVLYPGQPKPTNLHAVWDMNLVRACIGSLGALPYGDKLNAKISNRRAREWAKGTPEQWAWESHELAINQVYTVLPPKDGPPAQLDAEYIKMGKRIVDQQLMKAGVRLAETLNRALALVPIEPIPEGVILAPGEPSGG